MAGPKPMSPNGEQVAHDVVDRAEPLGLWRRLETPHVALASARRLAAPPLAPFPWPHRTGSQVPHQSQDQSHASSTPDITWTVTRSPPCSSRRKCRSPVLMSSVCISRPLPGGSLAFVSLDPT